ncbi:regulatory protein RecX [Treponema phagedenis]|uniref:regulatory protein RecX n=1 Tax=Treponema phagedenis TaxID=162 RepID=UPI001653246D|nr:regulatory protein RecX [Treponema phagedenis]
MNVKNTGSAVLDENSNSANDNIILRDIHYLATNLIKIYTESGISLITRRNYLQDFSDNPELLLNRKLSDREFDIVASAVNQYIIECSAVTYLNRAEHSVYQLQNKLIKKGFKKRDIEPVIDLLRNLGYIDDKRFADAWLRNRANATNEGYARLYAELKKRGISKAHSIEALKSFFAEHDEKQLCLRATRKQLKKMCVRSKIIQSLQRKGFSYAMAETCLKECGFYKNSIQTLEERYINE